MASEVLVIGSGHNGLALAWTKRVANRLLAHHLNLTLDAGAAYEMVNFLQVGRSGGQDRKILE